MNTRKDKPHSNDDWPKPDRWQVVLAAASLLVAIIALVR